MISKWTVTVNTAKASHYIFPLDETTVGLALRHMYNMSCLNVNKISASKSTRPEANLVIRLFSSVNGSLDILDRIQSTLISLQNSVIGPVLCLFLM